MEPRLTNNDIANGTLRDFPALTPRQILFALSFLVAILALLFLAPATHAAPDAKYTVNTILDNTTCDAGLCSLRGAILAANATAGKDTIKFNIPDGSCSLGTCTIGLNSALPFITAPVIIDGYTQPGASANTLTIGNDAHLRIRLNANVAMNGLVVQADNSVIRGLVMNNFTIAIHLQSDNNRVEGNFIGTNSTGTGVGGKNTIGIYVDGESNRIGDTTAAARNLISGNDIAILIANKYTNVQGNYIGTDAAGMNAVLNQEGIRLTGGHSSVIGGKGKLGRNVISGNDNVGIYIQNGAQATTMQNNLIGLTANAKGALGNNGSGIIIDGVSSNNLIMRNKIANNNGAGIRINDSGAPASNAVITRNSIFDNDALGIDLKNNGVTLNDAGDNDTGPNYLQNFPVIEAVNSATGTTTIKGQLNSKPGESYRIEFFISPECNLGDPNNYGEGKKYVGTADVKAKANGTAKFKFIKNKSYPSGQFITATATHLFDGYPDYTSEFSQCYMLGGS